MNAKNHKGFTPAIEKLNSWRLYRLVLVVAPAGAGKSALLREWTGNLRNSGIAGSRMSKPAQVIWIDLGDQDNEPERFLSTFFEPLRAAGMIEGRSGPEKWLEMQRVRPGSPDPISLPIEGLPRFEFGMTVLSNELAHLQDELIVVLDQYHHIVSPEIHNAMDRLLEHLPPKLHLVIACREEPPLALPRLRARRQMVDILRK
jgi:LuxR family maltose regulon positive regulatory protein